MKKYIRTKDGEIIDLSSGWEIDCEIGNNYSLLYYDEDGDCRDAFMLSKEDILKQADTIEELCDEFVLEDRKDKINRHFTEFELVPCIYCYDKKNVTVYGAIWTDTGLTYKAKMDDEEEWELL